MQLTRTKGSSWRNDAWHKLGHFLRQFTGSTIGDDIASVRVVIEVHLSLWRRTVQAVQYYYPHQFPCNSCMRHTNWPIDVTGEVLMRLRHNPSVRLRHLTKYTLFMRHYKSVGWHLACVSVIRQTELTILFSFFYAPHEYVGYVV